MTSLLDATEIEIPCGACGRHTQKPIGWIRTHEHFSCPCGNHITLDTEEFARQIQAIGQSLAELDLSMKTLEE